MSDATADLLERARAADFEDWYRERRYRQNAREGNFSYNGPRDPPAADLHFPSSLLQCHRKRRYDEANAPAEDAPPRGHFWVGSSVETDLVLPFLEDRVAGPGEYVTAGMGFETDIEGPDADSLRIRGKTDPVITDASGTPLLPTEVKTVQDLDRLSGPRDRHRAQVHAYLLALSDRVDGSLEEALLLYVSKSTLAIEVFRVTFDESFWTERVLPWMADLTEAREEGTLPPAEPVASWECTHCRFKRRCGQTAHPAADSGPVGFIPRYEYPVAAVRSHLAATDAVLTPTLAMAYPDLASENPVADWHCPACGATYAYEELDSRAEPAFEESAGMPACPACRRRGTPAELGGPVPSQGWIESTGE